MKKHLAPLLGGRAIGAYVGRSPISANYAELATSHPELLNEVGVELIQPHLY